MTLYIILVIFFSPLKQVPDKQDTIWLETDSSLYQPFTPVTTGIDELLILGDSCDFSPAERLALKDRVDYPSELTTLDTDLNWEVKQERKTDPTFLFYLLLLSVVLFVFARQFDPNYIRGLWSSFKNYSLSAQFYEDHHHQTNRLDPFLFFNSLLITSSMFYLVLKKLGKMSQLPSLELWVIILAIISICFLGKKILIRMIAGILPVKETLLFYNFNSFLIFNTFAICILPLLFFIAFAPSIIAQSLLWVLLFLVVSFLLYQIYRAYLVSKSYIMFHKFHFFIYLCTFEIAPLLIIYKLLGPSLVV